MNDLEIFINAPDGLTDSELTAYFDKVCGSDTESACACGGTARGGRKCGDGISGKGAS